MSLLQILFSDHVSVLIFSFFSEIKPLGAGVSQRIGSFLENLDG